MENLKPIEQIKNVNDAAIDEERSYDDGSADNDILSYNIDLLKRCKKFWNEIRLS